MNIEQYQIKLEKERFEIGFELYECIEDDKSLKSKSQKYSEYMKSNKYAALKNIRQELDGNKCKMCKTGNNLQFHHLTYENLYNENLKDGITLCGDCHKKHHRNIKKQKEFYNKKNKESDKNIMEYKILTKSNKSKPLTKKQQQKNACNNKKFVVDWLINFSQKQGPNTDAAKESSSIIAIQQGVPRSKIDSLRNSCGLFRNNKNGTEETDPIFRLTQIPVDWKTKDCFELRKTIEEYVDLVIKEFESTKEVVQPSVDLCFQNSIKSSSDVELNEFKEMVSMICKYQPDAIKNRIKKDPIFADKCLDLIR